MYLDVQNFIGLTIADGYIACGSETNAVSIFIPTQVGFLSDFIEISKCSFLV